MLLGLHYFLRIQLHFSSHSSDIGYIAQCQSRLKFCKVNNISEMILKLLTVPSFGTFIVSLSEICLSPSTSVWFMIDSVVSGVFVFYSNRTFLLVIVITNMTLRSNIMYGNKLWYMKHTRMCFIHSSDVLVFGMLCLLIPGFTFLNQESLGYVDFPAIGCNTPSTAVIDVLKVSGTQADSLV